MKMTMKMMMGTGTMMKMMKMMMKMMMLTMMKMTMLMMMMMMMLMMMKMMMMLMMMKTMMMNNQYVITRTKLLTLIFHDNVQHSIIISTNSFLPSLIIH